MRNLPTSLPIDQFRASDLLLEVPMFTQETPTSDLVPLDLSGYEITFRAYYRPGGTPVITRSVGNGIVIDANTWTLSIPTSDLAPLTAASYYYEITFVDSQGATNVYFAGRFNLIANAY